MTSTTTLLERNEKFSKEFTSDNLPILPKLRTVIITCGDARVDPAHTLGIELGEAVIIRNNGGRVTQSVIEELAAISFMVAKMDGDQPKPFEVIVVHHTQCGAERFADKQFQAILKEHVGVDVSDIAIHNHQNSILEDVNRLRAAPNIPDYIIVSGFIYDVTSGQMQVVVTPSKLSLLNS
jgi:carbonic anhydrase